MSKAQQFMNLVIDSSLRSAGRIEQSVGNAYGQITTSVSKGMALIEDGRQTMSTAFDRGMTMARSAYDTTLHGVNTAKRGYNTVKDTFYDETGWRRGRLAAAGAIGASSLYMLEGD